MQGTIYQSDIFNELDLWVACKPKMTMWSKIMSIISQENKFACKFTQISEANKDC